MPSLEDVRQTFIADTAPYISALRAAADAAKAFAAANLEALASVRAMKDEMGGATGSAVALISAEKSLADAMADKSAEAMFQSSRLRDLSDQMGITFIAAHLVALAEADLGRQLAITAGVTELAIRANGDLAVYAALAAQGLQGQQRALGETSKELVLASEAAGYFGRAEYDLVAVMLEKTGAASKQGGALRDLSGDMAAAAASTVVLSAAEAKVADSTKKSTGITVGWWRLTANQLHWIIAGTAEYLAVALPGTIALGLGAFVLYQGAVEQVGFRLQSLYTTTEATNAMLGKTTGDVLGLGHAFQSMQDKANPLAFELLGAYINGARANMTNFAQAGYQVDQALAELAARIDVDLRDHAAEFQGLLQDMVKDLVEFGQILGNVGHALLNFAADMPGLAEVLLKVADGISKVILWISELPHWLILSFMAFEEFIRWGGLLLGWVAKFVLALGTMTEALGATSLANWMGDAAASMQSASAASTHFFTLLRNMLVGTLGLVKAVVVGLFGLGAEMVAVAGEEGILAAVTYGLSAAFDAVKLAIFAIPGWGWALAGIAVLGGLVAWFGRSNTAAGQLGNTLETKIAKSSNAGVLDTIAQSIGKVNEALSQTPKYANDSSASFGKFGEVVKNYVHPMTQSYLQLTQTQQNMIGQFNQVTSGADKISRAYGTNFAQSLGLADAAGIKLSSTEITLGAHANVAGQEIENMVAGYKALNQVGGILGTDMNVLAVQAGLADTKVSQLNSAWDQFISNATGVTSSLAALNQDLTQVGNVGVQVGKKFEVMSGTQVKSINAVAKSLSSFSGTSAQTWQNYDAALNQAQQFTDQLRIASAYGAVTQRNYKGAIADTVASLLPFTSHSKTAVAELAALAQEAGGPATDSYKTLKDWVDKNKISSQDFNKAIQDMTAQMGNAGKAAQEFASTLQQQMQSALAAALIKGSNLNTVVGQFQQAVLKSGGQISASSPQYKALAGLLQAAGLTAKQAKNEIQVLQNTINEMHGKSVNVNVNTNYTETGSPGGGGMPRAPSFHGGVFGFAGGGMVNGPGGMDKAMLASLTAGEAVLNARAVAAIGGPMSIHSLNNQPSHAVLTSGGGGGGGGGVMNLTQHVVVELNGSKIASQWRTDQLIYNRRNNSANTQLRVR